MSIIRINEFNAQTGKDEDLKTLLASVIPVIKGSDGCQGCRLLQKQDDPLSFIVIEEWTSVEAHAASASNIPAELLQAAMALLAGAPKGVYLKDC